MRLSAQRNDAVTGSPPLELYYELYIRRDGPVGRIRYRLLEKVNRSSTSSGCKLCSHRAEVYAVHPASV